MPYYDPPQSFCRLGVTRCDVTPPVGMYHRMWGAATHDRSTGVHRPLTATAAVFGPLHKGEGGEQVLIALDHCLLWAGEMEAVLDRICARTALAREQVVVAFSHTHAAGLLGRERVGLPGGDLIPAYLDRLGERLAGLVEEARLRPGVPAGLAYATGRCPLAAHRDFWD